jgi:tRNA splicing ligase
MTYPRNTANMQLTTVCDVGVICTEVQMPGGKKFKIRMTYTRKLKIALCITNSLVKEVEVSTLIPKPFVGHNLVP